VWIWDSLTESEQYFSSSSSDWQRILYIQWVRSSEGLHYTRIAPWFVIKNRTILQNPYESNNEILHTDCPPAASLFANMSKPNKKWTIYPTYDKMDNESNWRNQEKNQDFFNRTVYDYIFLNHALCIWEFQTNTRNAYQRNIEELLHIYLFVWWKRKEKVLNISIVCLNSCHNYPACNAHAPYHIVICGLSDCTIFFHIIS